MSSVPSPTNNDNRVLQMLVPPSQRIHIRMGQQQVGSLSTSVHSVGDLLFEKRGKLALVCFAATLVLLLLGSWQAYLIRAALSVAVILMVAPHSISGRFCSAVAYYYLKRKRLCVEDDAVLQNEEIDFLSFCPNQTFQGRPHNMQPNRFLKPKRCGMCGKLTARGISRTEPMRCQNCGVVVCGRCAPCHLREDCRGWTRGSNASSSVFGGNVQAVK